jgi:hypothetical protein
MFGTAVNRDFVGGDLKHLNRAGGRVGLAEVKLGRTAVVAKTFGMGTQTRTIRCDAACQCPAGARKGEVRL